MDRLIPFSPDVYVSIFGGYNAWAWPAFAVAAVITAVALSRLLRGDGQAGRLLALSIAASWIWTGWAFHLETYAMLNWAAVPFGWLFIAQGLGCALWAGLPGRVPVIFHARYAPPGFFLMACALALHPLLVLVSGDAARHAHLFGITPAPVAAASVAALFFLKGRGSLWLLAWPVVWSAWDLASAWRMMLYRDAALPALTLAAAVFLIFRARR